MKYYKDTNNQLYVDPILDNHTGLTELTKEEFDAQLVINNTPTQEQLDAQRIAELKQLLAESDFKVLPDYDQDNLQIKIDRLAWREEIRQLQA
jgi:hypothetical protein